MTITIDKPDYLELEVAAETMLKIIRVLNSGGIVELQDGTRGIHLSLNEDGVYGVLTTRGAK